MAIILDADVLIAGERGKFDLAAWLRSHAKHHFELAAITVAELWHGVERASGQHRASREEYLSALLNVLPVIPYTEQTAYHHARLWATLESTGTMIGPYDLIVAATALERKSTIATFNKRHLGSLPGLKIVEPK